MALTGTICRLVFGISEQEATFARRGFKGTDPEAQQHLESMARTFIYGYNIAISTSNIDRMSLQLQQLKQETQGFAFEGAAMGLAILDYVSPWRQRFQTYLAGPGNPHIYMAHVGIGWTFARLPGQYKRVFHRLDPLLRWLALDGYGFHEGFFSWSRTLQHHFVPVQLKGYAIRAFDQGVGRSLWFVHGADGHAICRTIATFPIERQADLWSGVGLACAYAGGRSECFSILLHAVGPYFSHFAQGVAFAVKARQRAKNASANTELACQTFCGLSSDAAAALTDTALCDLPKRQNLPAYELWRQRIQSYFIAPPIKVP